MCTRTSRCHHTLWQQHTAILVASGLTNWRSGVAAAPCSWRIEVPAEYASVPLAAPFAADGSVQTDVGWNVAAVGQNAVTLRAGVFQQPVAVLACARERVSKKSQRAGGKVQGVLPADVTGLAITIQTFRLPGDGFASPIEHSSRLQQWAAASVVQAADDLSLGT
jgi:hypothetical protein